MNWRVGESKATSPTHQLANSPTHQLTNSPTHQFTNSPIRQFAKRLRNDLGAVGAQELALTGAYCIKSGTAYSDEDSACVACDPGKMDCGSVNGK